MAEPMEVEGQIRNRLAFPTAEPGDKDASRRRGRSFDPQGGAPNDGAPPVGEARLGGLARRMQPLD